MKNRFFLVVAVVMAAVVLTGCGKMPQESIDAAKLAVETAQKAQADVYMAPEYKALQDSLASVMNALESENSKFMKDFDELKAKLDTITVKAQAMTAEVPSKKEVVKAEAVSMVATVKTEMEATKVLLTKAPRGKEGKAALAQINSELEAIAGNVTEIENSLNEDVNYAEALDKLQAARKSVMDINTELTEAIAKKNGR